MMFSEGFTANRPQSPREALARVIWCFSLRVEQELTAGRGNIIGIFALWPLWYFGRGLARVFERRFPLPPIRRLWRARIEDHGTAAPPSRNIPQNHHQSAEPGQFCRFSPCTNCLHRPPVIVQQVS